MGERRQLNFPFWQLNAANQRGRVVCNSSRGLWVFDSFSITLTIVLQSNTLTIARAYHTRMQTDGFNGKLRGENEASSFVYWDFSLKRVALN